MFSNVLKEVTGVLDRRFLLNAFFPSLFFWGLLAVVALVGVGWDLTQVAQVWNQQDGTFKIIQIVGFLSWVTFFSAILASQFTAILRFYEGYWNFPLSRFLSTIGKNWHQARLKTLDFDEQINKIEDQLRHIQSQQEQIDLALQQNSSLPLSLSQQQSQLQTTSSSLNSRQQEAQLIQTKIKFQKQEAQLKQQQAKIQQNEASLYDEIYLCYPWLTQPEKVMPTRLGNILKNSELYSSYRYELDSALIWPRLYNLFPDRFRQVIAEAKSSLDFMLVISALSSIFALLSGGYLLTVKASGWVFLLCFWGGFFIAFLAYRSALSSALIYAEQIKAGFDLYRNELLKQMRLPLPKTTQEEIELWNKISEFLYRSNTQVGWQYIEPDITKVQNLP